MAIKIFVCGDIVNRVSLHDFIGKDLKNEIEKSDFAICNLEGPEQETSDSRDTLSFTGQVYGTIEYLKTTGFKMLLLANNHITDMGQRGIKITTERIESNGMLHVGAALNYSDSYMPQVVTIAGKKLGFLNYSEAQNSGQFYSEKQSFGYSWIGNPDIFKNVQSLSQQTDYTFVFIHAGLEHYPIPLPEYRLLYRKLCEAGASCVIGGHTHTAQGFEYYNNKLIIYSLGNFYFPRSNEQWEKENYSYSSSIIIDDDGRISHTPIFHSLKNNVVDIECDISNQIDINELCMLLDDEYEIRVNKMCVEDYLSMIEKRIAYCTCGEYERMRRGEIIKNIVKTLFLRDKYVKQTLYQRRQSLLPLFENESRRYSIIRALKVLNSMI